MEAARIGAIRVNKSPTKKWSIKAKCKNNRQTKKGDIMHHGHTVGHRTQGENIVFAHKLLRLGIYDAKLRHIQPVEKKKEKKRDK